MSSVGFVQNLEADRVPAPVVALSVGADREDRAGIFATYAPLYWSKGLQVIPLVRRDKMPVVTAWQTWGKQRISDDLQNSWLQQYGYCNIGIPAGPASGLSFIDLDILDSELLELVEKYLPKSPWRRVGKKGCVLAYQASDTPSFKIKASDGDKPLIEFFSTSGQVVLPPSVHPETLAPYTASANLWDVAHLVPKLSPNIERELRELLQLKGKINLATSGVSSFVTPVAAGGRDDKMIRGAGRFALEVRLGRMTLLEALTTMADWVEDNFEKVEGDNADAEKGQQRVVQWLISDIKAKNLILPKGWDAGLTPEQKTGLGLDVLTEDDVSLDAAEIKSRFADESKEDDLAKATDQALRRIARSREVSSVEADGLLAFIKECAGKKVQIGTLRRQLLTEQKARQRAEADNEDDKGLPIIHHEGGELPAVLDACDAALRSSGIGIYVQVNRLVELGEQAIEVRDGIKVRDNLLSDIGPVRLRELLTSVAVFKASQDGEIKTINCPRDVAEGYLARPGTWGVRALSGIINAPTLRSDGTILDQPGYDEKTGLFYDPKGCEFPPIPEKPTREDAFDALAVLDELFGLFPFASPESHSVALAGLLTGVNRRVLPAAPYFGYDAPEAGSGKGKLADVTAIIASGRKAATCNYGPSEEEFDKRFSSFLMRGDLCINVDNITRPIEGEQLCTAATQNPCDFRILGHSKLKTVPTNANVYFTGNNMGVKGDAYRRVLFSVIDPKMERPGDRKFPFDPVERALKERPRYVVACLTILRAYQVAGRPPQNGRVMGSFEAWTRTVRDALLWLGCADPVQLVEIQSEADSEREQLAQLIELWKAEVGLHAVTVKQLVAIGARKLGALIELLREIALGKDGITVDTAKLSGYLRKHKNRPIGDSRITKGKTDALTNTGTWKLEQVSVAPSTAVTGDTGVTGGFYSVSKEG